VTATKVKKSVTLGDVARAAGVSVMTASNVASGKINLVKAETADRVRAAITRIGYRPNVSARSLRLSQTHSIGMVISDTDPAYLTAPFTSRMVSGLSNYLSSLDYTLDIQGVTPERFESSTILNKAGNDALCAILCGPKPLRKKQLIRLQALGQPVLVFNEVLSFPLPGLAVVRQDDIGGGRLLGKYLLTKKARTVYFLRPALDWSATEQREKGLRQALESAGRHVEVTTIIAASENFEDVEAATREAVSKKLPSAIAVSTDSMAAAALYAVETLGLKVPNDIMVTGFNGFDVDRLTRPTLTTVLSQAYNMGRYAGELLLERLRSGAFPTETPVFPVLFKVGDSA
jgi:LacI family transcriptional regulator